MNLKMKFKMTRKRVMIGCLASCLILAVPIGCMGFMSKPNKELLAFPEQKVSISTVAGRSLSYREAGNPEGQRVIFIHGSPGDGGAWISYLQTPIDEFDTVAVDRLGYGNSVSAIDENSKEKRTAVVSFHEQAEAVVPLLVERNGKWPILVGHSLGGPIAAQLAAEHPDKVGGILILAGALDPAYESPRWYTTLFSSKLTRWVLPGPLKQSNKEMLSTLAETKSLEKILDQITCPVIVLHGKEDDLVPVGNVDYMRERFINAKDPEYIRLEKQGHFLPWEQEPLVRDLIEKLAEKMNP